MNINRRNFVEWPRCYYFFHSFLFRKIQHQRDIYFNYAIRIALQLIDMKKKTVLLIKIKKELLFERIMMSVAQIFTNGNLLIFRLQLHSFRPTLT